MTVERTELAPGLEISRLVTGLWQIADLEREGPIDLDAAAASMLPYADAGLTTFDMADHYGSAEDIAGRFATTRSGDTRPQLLTKWVPEPGTSSPDDVRAAVQTSLDRLQADAIDLLQFHAWRYFDPDWLDCLFALQELKEAGLIRNLGLTNFDAAHLDMVLHSGVDVVSNQVSFSLLDRRAAGPMRDVCERHGVQLLAFGTLAGGLLTERWLDAPDPGADGFITWSEMKYSRYVEAVGGWERLQNLLRAVASIAEKHDVSMANVACRAVLDDPSVAGVIVGARLGQSEHIADNLRVFGFAMDDEDRAALAEAQAELDPLPGDCGDEYRRPPFLTASGDLSHHLDGFPAPYETVPGPNGRTRALSGTVWEDIAGFSRAVRDGDEIFVSGTTATHRDKVIGGDDPAAQMHFVIDKIEGAIESLGGTLEDIVRTRLFIHREDVWEGVSRAHGRRLGTIAPANTLVQVGLIGEGYLIEMEAEARVRSARD